MEMKFEDIEKLFNERQNQFDKMPSEALWEQLDKQLPTNKPVRKIASWRYWVAAAVVLLCLVPLAWFSSQHVGDDASMAMKKEMSTEGVAAQQVERKDQQMDKLETANATTLEDTEEILEAEAEEQVEGEKAELGLSQEVNDVITEVAVDKNEDAQNVTAKNKNADVPSVKSEAPPVPQTKKTAVTGAKDVAKTMVEKNEQVEKSKVDESKEEQKETSLQYNSAPVPTNQPPVISLPKIIEEPKKEEKVVEVPVPVSAPIVEEEVAEEIVEEDEPVKPQIMKEEVDMSPTIKRSSRGGAKNKPAPKPAPIPIPEPTPVPAPTPQTTSLPTPPPPASKSRSSKELIIPPPPAPSDEDRGANMEIAAPAPPPPPPPAPQLKSAETDKRNLEKSKSARDGKDNVREDAVPTSATSAKKKTTAAPVVEAEKTKPKVNEYTRYYIAKLTNKIPKIDEDDIVKPAFSTFAGKWQYVKNGVRYTETWEEMPSGAYRITTVSKYKGEVVYEEKISLQEDAGTWYYNINTDQGIVRYQLSKQTDELLDFRIVEEVANFPKRIVYQKKNNKKMYVYFRKDENGKKIKSYITLTK